MIYIITTQKNKKEKKLCPVCNHVLYERHEGLVCKNYKCCLYFKLGKGWVYVDKKHKWTRERHIINTLWDKNSKNILAQKWAQIKAKVLVRDNYTCLFCDYKLSKDWNRKKRGKL